MLHKKLKPFPKDFLWELNFENIVVFKESVCYRE